MVLGRRGGENDNNNSSNNTKDNGLPTLIFPFLFVLPTFLFDEPAFIFGVSSSGFTPLAVEVVMSDEMIGPDSLSINIIEDGFQVFGSTFGEVIPPVEELALLVRLAITTPVAETGLLLLSLSSLAYFT